MQIVLSCLKEAMVAKGGTNVSPLKPLAEIWTAKRQTNRGEVTLDAWHPGKFWGAAAARERKPALFGTFRISEKLSTVPEMSGMTFHPDWKMPSPTQNASAEKAAGTSNGRKLLPGPQVRPSFLFPQMALGGGVMDGRLHSWAHA